MKVCDLVSTRTSVELSFAAQMSVGASGKRTVADLLKEISEASSDEVAKVWR